MLEKILLTAIPVLLTILHISVTAFMGYIIKRDFEYDGFKSRWKNLTVKEKSICYVLIGFPVIAYFFATYLLIDTWIIVITLM